MGNNGVISTDNSGIIQTGSGSITVSAKSADDPDPSPGPDPETWDLGVVTVLSVETRALIAALSRRGTQRKTVTARRERFREFRWADAGRPVRVAVTQALHPGQLSAGSAVAALRDAYAPRFLALVGIAGAIHPDLRLGDVVVAQEVVHYEPRKVTPEGIRRRGRSHPVAAEVQHAVNDFFTEHDEPWPLPGAGDHRARRGPIGSGEAVLADTEAAERAYLRQYNEKVLAVETEGAGLAEAVYAGPAHGAPEPWLIVRGMSDTAGPDKDDQHHAVAARNAAEVFCALLPHLL
ncbi:5'-methylthioadenosine/S-adenosylhomocysteine nucleosidase family protein [Streptomyces flavofungini]|uniref:Nucleoside phosphorylase domain-containing protein n=1 Tax=Streptomyces flavofungini TaxID=68200 RepID=A0ABS0X8U5_9ACTN|nr:hypothetical protein [Streptomyces flavofungini]MBJ3809625.1 hypothetical protein [Streptomyces flavofungini]GHC55844.1 purine phosphorylase [Streptomyces flavofungini]